jgi:hypothetical protein
LTLASLSFVASSADARVTRSSISATNVIAANTVEPQRRNRFRRWNNHRRVRTVTRTRLVRRGRHLYRETYQIKYLPNGRTLIRRISLVRIR